MPTMRVVSREEAQGTRGLNTTGDRRVRMARFDAYAPALVEHPDRAIAYEDLGEEPSKFVLSLRQAFRRAGVPAVVRKTPRRNEVRAWRGTSATHVTVEPSKRAGTAFKTTRRAQPARTAFTRQDPLFWLIGLGEGKTPAGVSDKKDEALADAYRPQ